MLRKEKQKKKQQEISQTLLPQIPQRHVCSITGLIMSDPVFTDDGHTYEREAIEEWLKTHDTNPLTNEKLDNKKLRPNKSSKSDISEFLDGNPEFYETDEIYLPKSWIAELVKALKAKQPAPVNSLLEKDRRLLTLKLEGEYTAFHLAAEFGSPELTNILFENLTKKNLLDKVMAKPAKFNPTHLNVLLQQSLEQKDKTRFLLLLKLAAELEQTEPETESTLLHQAVVQNNTEAVTWLLEQKASLETPNAEGNTALLLSVLEGNVELTAFLLKMKANPHVKNHLQQNPTSLAILAQNKSIISLLLDEQKAALPPLHLALVLKDLDILKALLKKVGSTVSLEALDGQKRTPFYAAVEQGNTEAIKLLLQKGANASIACGTEQLTPLHVAASLGHLEILKLLLQTKATIDFPNANGDTPLHFAAKLGQDSVIPLLLESGAYHKAKNAENKTPIELAREHNKPKTAELIEKTARALKQAKFKEIETLQLKLQTLENSQAARLAELEKEKTAIQNVQAARLAELEKALSEQEKILKPLKEQAEREKQQREKAERERLAEIERQRALAERQRLEQEKQAGLEAERKRQPQVSAFLKFVAEGEQDQAEGLLQKDPTLALYPSDVRDLSDRTFKGITGFQYAVWALDWHMWTMIRKYLPNDQASIQIKEMETAPWTAQHGKAASWQNLLDALKSFTTLCEQSEYGKAATQWNTGVGGAQRLLPVHVVNEYCRPDRPFDPCPDFTTPLPLPRTRVLNAGEWFTCTYGGDVLGKSFATVRGAGRSPGGAWWGSQFRPGVVVPSCEVGWGAGMADRAAGHTLLVTRTQQRDLLFAELGSSNRQGNRNN